MAAASERWRADLQQLASELPRPHKELFFRQPRAEWEARVADLDAALDGLEDHEIVVEFMRLVASVGDGHTAIRLGQGPVAHKVFPVEFHPFTDGLHVVRAPRELAWALGARVTAVGGVPIDEVWSCVAEIIDLRWNGGGNSLVIQPLLRLLGRQRELREKGVLFVAIGEDTFSSAMMNAVELRRGFGALLVGTPTGGKPRSYGEIKFLRLAQSGLEVSYSTRFFELAPDDSPSVLPDLAAPAALAHWREGRDPVLEAIAAWRAQRAAEGDADSGRR
ncbi:MAG: hypothetical protein FJ293_12700 [Planctomycetes bacterium]|nr:hypothetical protein [Planctomycetota bacterium]